ncbi:MAG: hypothetical protein HYW77_02765 [Parcubacteria group bacterium]|nr:hypothetical protein [Parcubacteria group bacterium]
MKKIKLQNIFSILFILFGSFLILVSKASAEVAFVRYLPKLGSGSLDPANIQDLGGLFNYLFTLGIWVVGLAMFVQFLRAGIDWFFAGPNLTKVQSAKEKMSNALLGFALVLSAWLILNVINPDLVGQTTKLPAITPP